MNLRAVQILFSSLEEGICPGVKITPGDENKESKVGTCNH